MFVSFEGIEASGKTTVIKQIAHRLNQDRYSVDLLREFASTSARSPVEHATRKCIFFSLGLGEGPQAALLYMLYHEAAKWGRAEGGSRDVMLADRFFDSIVVYQGHFLPTTHTLSAVMLGEMIEHLMRQLGIPVPDVTYLLDVSPERSAERFANREGRQLTDFESDQIGQIRASLITLANSNSRIVRIDANRPLECVVDEIYEDLCLRLRQICGTPGHRNRGAMHIQSRPLCAGEEERSRP